MITAPYERIWITVRYACNHYAARPVFRTPESESDARSQGSLELCEVCEELERQEEARRKAMPQENVAIHYIVDGYPMTITRDKGGYWRGRRWEHGKFVNKYFGKVDPRPLLEEAL